MVKDSICLKGDLPFLDTCHDANILGTAEISAAPDNLVDGH